MLDATRRAGAPRRAGGLLRPLITAVVAAQRAAVDAARAGVVRALIVAGCAEAREVSRARAGAAAGDDVVDGQRADATAALGPRTGEPTVLTFAGDRGS